MSKYIFPLYNYRISSKFGFRSNPITGQTTQHYGIDLSAPEGEIIMSIADGVVLLEGFHGKNGYIDQNGNFVHGKGFGNNIFIEHSDGNISHYAHLKTCSVKSGDTVIQGQHIGNVGNTGESTGSHLHFEILDGNVKVPNTNKTISQILIETNKRKKNNHIDCIGFSGSIGRYDPITGRTMDDIKNGVITNEDCIKRAIYNINNKFNVKQQDRQMCKINTNSYQYIKNINS